jgi:ABC-type multidrug transport system fused ATPase/permease subunit
MIALFRFQELSEGSITIDNIDISQVPLKLLRSRLGIIPQDPVMFSATVRFNLDPFEQYSDLHIWQVLEDIHLKDHILSLPGKLSEMVAEGGDNFSAGQRQVHLMMMMMMMLTCCLW